jgi:hypothetical protein
MHGLKGTEAAMLPPTHWLKPEMGNVLQPSTNSPSTTSTKLLEREGSGKVEG